MDIKESIYKCWFTICDTEDNVDKFFADKHIIVINAYRSEFNDSHREFVRFNRHLRFPHRDYVYYTVVCKIKKKIKNTRIVTSLYSNTLQYSYNDILKYIEDEL